MRYSYPAKSPYLPVQLRENDMSPDVIELHTALQKEFKQPVFLFVLPHCYMLQLNDLRKALVPHNFKKSDVPVVIAGLKTEPEEKRETKKPKVK